MEDTVGRGATPRRLLFPAVAVAVAAAIVVVVAFAAVLLNVGANGRGGVVARPTPTLQGGADMQGHPAPAFTLRDQDGAVVSLQALHGRPVVLTFLDGTCTEQCPLMVQYLNWTTQFMTRKQVDDVAWVAITVNPNNTRSQASAFLAKNKAAVPIRFLLGSQAELQPLWKAYYIAVEPGQTDVVHTSGLYVIDQQGRERVWMDAGFDPKALAGDLQELLGTT